MQYLIKIPAGFFAEIERLPLKFIWKCHWPTTYLEKKDKVGRLTLSDFKIYYKATVMNQVWHWHKDRQIEQGNGIENPDMDPLIYTVFIFDMVPKQFNREGTDFSTNDVETNGYLYVKNEVTPFSHYIGKLTQNASKA